MVQTYAYRWIHVQIDAMMKSYAGVGWREHRAQVNHNENKSGAHAHLIYTVDKHEGWI